MEETFKIRVPDGVQPEQEFTEPPPQEGTGETVWIGAPDAPRQASDGISDLFDPGTEDDTSDLVSVNFEEDIIDANPETGDLSDLVDVSEDDVLGDEETGQMPLNYRPAPQQVRRVQRRTSPSRYTPPTSVRGQRY